MCLAIPARVSERAGEDAWVTIGCARIRVSVCMTPEVALGDWVLVHAGFAIEQIDERAAHEMLGMIAELDGGREEGVAG